jgi:hypothetical protein
MPCLLRILTIPAASVSPAAELGVSPGQPPNNGPH